MLASTAARWLPRDFVETSQLGGLYTLTAYGIMVFIFLCEIRAYFAPAYSTTMTLDRKDGEMLQLNFDVDMHDIECRNLKVAVFSQGGSRERMNTWGQDFWLRSVDVKGRAFGMASKPTELTEEEIRGEAPKESEFVDHNNVSGLHDPNWHRSHERFESESFDSVIKAHEFVLVNFFAGWCGHCQRFAPTWNQLAAKINDGGVESPLMFNDREGKVRELKLVKMNCVDHTQVCHDRDVDAYPTLRLYKSDGSFSLFEGKRDEADLVRWLDRTIKMKSYGWSSDHEAFERGCNAKGRILVPRVPGRLEWRPGDGDQNLNPRMTNVTHLVKHLSFSDPDDGRYHRKSWAGLPSEVLDHVSPLDGSNFVTPEFHQTWTHHFKVVSTVSQRGSTVYQFQHQKRLSSVPLDKVPRVRFHYDLEPFSVWVKQEEKKWYEFCTSLLAILGGAFASMRLASNASSRALQLIKGTLQRSRSKSASSYGSGGSINLG